MRSDGYVPIAQILRQQKAKNWELTELHIRAETKINEKQRFQIETIDGVPMLYYGDEIGMTGAGDPDNRRMMRFNDSLTHEEKAVKAHFSKVAKLITKFMHSKKVYISNQIVIKEDDVNKIRKADIPG